MKPSRIILIRHGESASNANPEVHATVPDWKVPLTDRGYVQAIDAARNLGDGYFNVPIDVYLSPFLRARQTWDAMSSEWHASRAFLPLVKQDPRLREQEWGHLRTAEQSDAIDAARQSYGTFFYRIPDGESGADVYDRCTGFLDTLYRDFTKDDFPNHVLIVTHGFTIRALLMRWLHWSVDEFHALKNPRNCEVFTLLRQPDDRYALTKPFPRRADSA